ncbi:MAG: hemolysin family protein [Actinomycetales bacterium]
MCDSSVLVEWLLLALGVVLTLMTGVFVAAEFSLITLDRPDVERAARTSPAAGRVLAGLKTLSTQLSGAQVGITLTTLLVGYLVEPSISRLLTPVFVDLGVSEAAVQPVAVTSGMVLATVVSMVVGELVPKNLAISVPMRTALWAVPLQRAFTWLFRPVITVLNGSANAILRSWGIEPQEELSSGRTPEELVFLVKRSAEAGTLDAGTATLVARSIDFSERSAADVMKHRVDVVAVEESATAADVVELAHASGHSRFPVTGDGGLDDIVGVVHIKWALAVPRERRSDAHVGSLMTEPLRVPETLRLDPLLARLRTHGIQLAVITDEYGGTAGIATIEDLVEELVGEVVDEHDREDPRVRPLGQQAYLIPGDLRPDEVQEAIGAPIPERPDYETVAGFILDELGRLASEGDEVSVPGWRLRVEEIAGRRIEEVRIWPDDRSGAEAAGPSGNWTSPKREDER